ncbi:hypothetical protein HBI56_034540 [Parastagonospora nodorum]|uniref:Uncharacterized protein n=1 Tax=Phaeosphaeria nodorum (strain SN15 / ATCC MYA-4574 / FGSC 10173) TaxID=321614 RepID=A0A7U2EYS4_PHANO|nr:hypothetical protein HBH56_022340 [Parastagonospora nodorum]QRC95576.1 hypothetical protein JI435_407550 [Parastagonospora nodorum SN15]KAH3937194.1 hypothetical protein HBH54_012140 [Parastagonospora nodorum]KAH3944074.1 hypothetical protein HBH53_164580 [Parastagonospora nodorum]KAH3967722.1 hypothetical protein HBH51_135590 [Parastagonospora nodorum]
MASNIYCHAPRQHLGRYTHTQSREAYWYQTSLHSSLFTLLHVQHFHTSPISSHHEPTSQTHAPLPPHKSVAPP